MTRASSLIMRNIFIEKIAMMTQKMSLMMKVHHIVLNRKMLKREEGTIDRVRLNL